MLFNSPVFIFFFLPTVLLGFYWISSLGKHQTAIVWLIASSLFFYGWWNPSYLGLILISILFNYGVGVFLKSAPQQLYEATDHNITTALRENSLDQSDKGLSGAYPPSKQAKTVLSFPKRKIILIFGVVGNLGLLVYFKYANFLVDNINALTGGQIVLEQIILPLAISFFTFQQIIYLVDTYRRVTEKHRFLHYGLFMTFFPQLIAGPIVHHREMLSQFTQVTFFKLKAENLSVGLVIFVIGLFKKVVIADGLATHADLVFAAAENGIGFTFLEAWVGALAFSLQLYFDFSGYSDMAIGLGRMFGIRFPLNFNSPYKSTSIIDFWRCWHMTLSRFFRDYLYIPLGGNRQGIIRNPLNLMITMLLGGLWHGASWTFVIWGALHGFYLILNHEFQVIRRIFGHDLLKKTILGKKTSQLITFLTIVIAWVIFRAESINGAQIMFQGMFGFNGFSFPATVNFKLLSLLAFSLFVVWCLPNTQEFMREYKPTLEAYQVDSKSPRKYFLFRLSPISFIHTLFIIVISLLSILAMHSIETTEFLYYNF